MWEALKGLGLSIRKPWRLERCNLGEFFFVEKAPHGAISNSKRK